VDDLAIEYSLSDETVFAINLCLEEALSNIIRHGHNEEPGHPLTVDACTDGRSMLLFTIEDQAPHFLPPEPMAPEGASRPVTIDELQPGGQGLPLLRRFANLLTWQQIPDGNRLTIGFDLALPTRGESS
jgi:anti-sigma regulatory factor (Ser/Thr protein kinase)